MKKVEAFIRRVQRQLGRGLVVVMDRLAAHKAAAKRLGGDGRFRVEWLPLGDAVAGILAGRLRNGILAVGVLAAAERLRADEHPGV